MHFTSSYNNPQSKYRNLSLFAGSNGSIRYIRIAMSASTAQCTQIVRQRAQTWLANLEINIWKCRVVKTYKGNFIKVFEIVDELLEDTGCWCLHRNFIIWRWTLRKYVAMKMYRGVLMVLSNLIGMNIRAIQQIIKWRIGLSSVKICETFYNCKFKNAHMFYTKINRPSPVDRKRILRRCPAWRSRWLRGSEIGRALFLAALSGGSIWKKIYKIPRDQTLF